MIKFIALCGYPKSGKTEVQKIIERRYGIEAYDDKYPLREAVKVLYGLTDWHVSTQGGKASMIKTPSGEMTVRKAMGDLGCYLEEKDEFHFARLAVSACLDKSPDKQYVFASVRQRQPIFFKNAGNSIVIEVTREGCGADDAFDEYDRSAIDLSIENILDIADPTAARARLEGRVAAMLDPILKSVSIPV